MLLTVQWNIITLIIEASRDVQAADEAPGLDQLMLLVDVGPAEGHDQTHGLEVRPPVLGGESFRHETRDHLRRAALLGLEEPIDPRLRRLARFDGDLALAHLRGRSERSNSWRARPCSSLSGKRRRPRAG